MGSMVNAFGNPLFDNKFFYKHNAELQRIYPGPTDNGEFCTTDSILQHKDPNGLLDCYFPHNFIWEKSTQKFTSQHAFALVAGILYTRS